MRTPAVAVVAQFVPVLPIAGPAQAGGSGVPNSNVVDAPGLESRIERRDRVRSEVGRLERALLHYEHDP